VFAEVRRPDGSRKTVVLTELEDGQFEGEFQTGSPGVYQFRIRAKGTSQSGQIFSREKTLTAAVWRGGDRAYDPTYTGQSGGNEDFICEFMRCLLRKNGILSQEMEKRLKAAGFNIEHARECFGKLCHEKD
ncbi:MAG TPA: hypothetical protein VFU29_06875, partial [Chitinophagaceae bacterium]|nr:hypothetical protein [Chitinophagaceae bacterium]